MPPVPSWFVPFGMAALAGVGSYYAAEVTLEHRITKLEEDTIAHAREDDRGTVAVDRRLDAADIMFRNLWHAIAVNHGDAPP